MRYTLLFTSDATYKGYCNRMNLIRRMSASMHSSNELDVLLVPAYRLRAISTRNSVMFINSLQVWPVSKSRGTLLSQNPFSKGREVGQLWTCVPAQCKVVRFQVPSSKFQVTFAEEPLGDMATREYATSGPPPPGLEWLSTHTHSFEGTPYNVCMPRSPGMHAMVQASNWFGCMSSASA
jgi:hypothetical protein